ncbi:MAG TPA: glycoside hydrolase family 16 protein [Bacteroidales bacterium]|nr:glycoside hydrolase family 16 protein [Bacteroidales bacterium]
MASLRLLLGLIPSTSKIELAEKTLISEFEKLKSISGSELLARYNELNDLVNSSGFLSKKKEIESLRYKDSEEYKKEKELLSLQKARDLVLYFKTTAGTALNRFREMDGSQKIKDFEALGSFIDSFEFKQKQKMKPVRFKDTDEYRKFLEYKALKSDPEIRSYLKAAAKGDVEKSKSVQRFEELSKYITSQEFLAKKNMKPVTFKDTEEYARLLDYKRQKKSADIKEYYAFRDSKEYANYLTLEGSQRLNRYYELKDYVASADFIERKNYLLDTKRFEKTSMFRELKEYENLKKNEDLSWYFKNRDSDRFDILKNRELTFSDEFEGSTIDRSLWLTRYYWGDKLLKDNYSVESDLHAYTSEGNFEARNSILRITTKPGKTNGKVWQADKGFTTKEFGYSSGIINTGASFRQKYGIFTAKIRLGNPSARNAFWLLSDRITPHIDICRTSDSRVWFDIFPSADKVFKSSIGSKYASGFYIYSLEWTTSKLVWKINGEEVFSRTTDIPQEPMYISLAGGLDKPINGMSVMEIDWVRVYQPK